MARCYFREETEPGRFRRCTLPPEHGGGHEFEGWPEDYAQAPRAEFVTPPPEDGPPPLVPDQL